MKDRFAGATRVDRSTASRVQIAIAEVAITGMLLWCTGATMGCTPVIESSSQIVAIDFASIDFSTEVLIAIRGESIPDQRGVETGRIDAAAEIDQFQRALAGMSLSDYDNYDARILCIRRFSDGNSDSLTIGPYAVVWRNVYYETDSTLLRIVKSHLSVRQARQIEQYINANARSSPE